MYECVMCKCGVICVIVMCVRDVCVYVCDECV